MSFREAFWKMDHPLDHRKITLKTGNIGLGGEGLFGHRRRGRPRLVIGRARSDQGVVHFGIHQRHKTSSGKCSRRSYPHRRHESSRTTYPTINRSLTTPSNGRSVVLATDASVAGFGDPSQLGARTAPHLLKRGFSMVGRDGGPKGRSRNHLHRILSTRRRDVDRRRIPPS